MSDLAAGPGGRDVSGGGIGMRQAPRARFQYPEHWEPQYVTGAEAVAAPNLLRRVQLSGLLSEIMYLQQQKGR